MGYSTEFEGWFELDPPLTPLQCAEVNDFNRQRHDRKDPRFPDVELDKYNERGEFVPGELGNSVWCGWQVFQPGGERDSFRCGLETMGNKAQCLAWDGREKSYSMFEWLGFLVGRFFRPWGVRLTGTVRWQGEGEDDVGKITCSVGPAGEQRAAKVGGMKQVVYDDGEVYSGE